MPMTNGATASTAAASGARYNKRIASRCMQSKVQLIPLTSTTLTPDGVSCASTGATFFFRVAAAAQFDAVRILIPNVATTSVTGVKASVGLANGSGGWKTTTLPTASGNTGAQINNNIANQALGGISGFGSPATGGGRKFLFGGKGEVDLPPAFFDTNMVASWTASDWVPITSAPRTDGGALPLVDVRVQYPPTTYTPISGAAASSPGVTTTVTNFANWGTDGAIDTARPFNLGHMWRMLAHNAQSVDAAANFQGSNTPTTIVNGPAIIIQFHTLTDVHTIVYCNDSIGEAVGAGEQCNSYAFRAAMAAGAATGKTVSWCPMTWYSGKASNYLGQLAQVMDYVQPEIVWCKPIGPNDAVGALTATNTSWAMSSLGFAVALGQRWGSKVIIEPMLATGTASTGATFTFVSGNAVITLASLPTQGGFNLALPPTIVASGYAPVGATFTLTSGTVGVVGSTYTMSAAAVGSGTVPAVTYYNAYGTTDSLRIAWNLQYATLAPTMGYTFVDTDTPWIASAVSPTLTGTAQVANYPTNSFDGTHGTEFGSANLSAAITPAITAVLAAA